MKLISLRPAVLTAAALAVAAALLSPALFVESHAKAPKTAPAWQLKDLDGKTVSSADFKGKVVILDFWATWCGPCVKEIPGFIELQKKYSKDGLVVIGVSLDDGPGVVKRFAATHKINYPIVMGNDGITKDFGGIEGIPTTFVIDRDGQIVKTHVGYTDKSVFEKDIKPLLQAAKP